jgi:hypothetical protein
MRQPRCRTNQQLQTYLLLLPQLPSNGRWHPCSHPGSSLPPPASCGPCNTPTSQAT